MANAGAFAVESALNQEGAENLKLPQEFWSKETPGTPPCQKLNVSDWAQKGQEYAVHEYSQDNVSTGFAPVDGSPLKAPEAPNQFEFAPIQYFPVSAS